MRWKTCNIYKALAFLSHMPTYDVAGDMCQALAPGTCTAT
jgi:hypothetical protein